MDFAFELISDYPMMDLFEDWVAEFSFWVVFAWQAN